MALKAKLTSAVIAKHLVPPSTEGAVTVVYDTEVAGFGAYRTSERPGTYFVHYRVNNRQRKATIGRTSEINVGDARARAAELKLAARSGRDLILERKRERDAAITLKEAYESYLEMMRRRGRSPETFTQYQFAWKLSLSKHQHRELRSISKAEARRWHDGWAKRGPTAANHARRLLRAIYNHALRTTDDLPPNPALAVIDCPEPKHRPLLTWEELPDWWTKVEGLPNPIRRAYWKFLLFSGLRRNDASCTRWDEIDGQFLRRPKPKGGAGRAFDLPLSTILLELLDEAKQAGEQLYPGSPFVFPADSASGHIATIREKAFPEVMPHMLRRTFATACIEAGVDPYTTKRLLNHKPTITDVTTLYVQPSPEYLLSAMRRHSDFILEKILVGSPPAAVK